LLVLVSFQGNQKEGSIDRLLVFLVWQIVEYIFAIIIWSSFGYIRRKERKKDKTNAIEKGKTIVLHLASK